MGRKSKSARVLGPYRESRSAGLRYRVVEVDENGGRSSFYACSEAEAAVVAEACRRTMGVHVPDQTTVGAAIQAFLEQKRRSGAWSPRTFERAVADFRAFAGDAPGAPIAAVGRTWLLSYLERIGHLALASRRSRYLSIGEFLRWCVRRSWLERDPCALLDRDDKPWLGKRAQREMGRGKPQLRNVDEARRYLASALGRKTGGERVATALPLLTGLRSGEVRHLSVGDIDREAGLLWVRDDEAVPGEDAWDVKSAASQRSVEIPACLRQDLETLCAGRKPGDLMLPAPGTVDRARPRNWLLRLVRLVCGAAGTRIVPPHGLRDTYATVLAAVSRSSDADIARALGHGDDGQTARAHYVGQPRHAVALPIDAAPPPYPGHVATGTRA